jgi:hypothetical protein
LNAPVAGSPGVTTPALPRRGAGLPFRPSVPNTLRALYEQYCRVEARELLALLPREGRRALMRREAASGGEMSVEGLHQAARGILPLPTYEVWVPSYLANRKAYLERLGIPALPAREVPVTVAIRPMASGWWAHLNLRRVDEGWLGFIAFLPDTGDGDRQGASDPSGSLPPGGRTAEIFRGPDPEMMRTRFLEFGEAAMEGFLRSAAP